MDAYKLYRQLQEKEKQYKDYDNYDRADLIDIILDNEEKQEQLITWLEDKIKKCDVIMQMSIDSLNDKFADKKDEENVRRTLKITIRECEIEIKAFQEVLDFVKGGKDE